MFRLLSCPGLEVIQRGFPLNKQFIGFHSKTVTNRFGKLTHCALEMCIEFGLDAVRKQLPPSLSGNSFALIPLRFRGFCLSHIACISYISFPMHPAKWQSEWGSLKSASIRQRNVVRKCFALFTFLLRNRVAPFPLRPLVPLVLVLSVVRSVYLSLSPSLSPRSRCVLQQDIRHPRVALRCPSRLLWFLVLSLRFLSRHWTCCSH